MRQKGKNKFLSNCCHYSSVEFYLEVDNIINKISKINAINAGPVVASLPTIGAGNILVKK